MTVLAFVIGIVVLIAGLAVSIALHEVGHLVPAKLFRVHVGQYMVGLGPTLFRKRFGETEYGVKALPLGGFISMSGMYPPSATPAGGAVASERRGRFFAAMVQDARAANDETVVGTAENRLFYRLPVYKRVIVMLGGPVMNLVLAVILFTILLSGIGVNTATATISSLSDCVPAATGECTPGSTPAEEAGLQSGDRIVSIDGTPVADFADATAIVQRSTGQQLSMVIERSGVEQTVQITPTAVDAAATGATGDASQVGFVGIRPVIAYVQQPIWAGASAAGQNVAAVAGIMVQLPVKVYDTAVSLVTGAERDPNGPLSVVGASVIAGEAAASAAPILDRVAFIVGLLGSLNIALFVFNLIPLLPLDGGHVVVALWDGIKRIAAKLRGTIAKPVDATRLVPLTFVVVIALFAMGGVLIVADLVNPISLG